jgi:hypothetical protein
MLEAQKIQLAIWNQENQSGGANGEKPKNRNQKKTGNAPQKANPLV